MDNIYEIIIEKKAKKFLKKQDIATQRRIIAAIRDLPLGDVKKLKGSSSVTYRLRVGSFRILFQKNESELIIIDINNRGQVYK